jgi:hypothetical protein
MGSRVLDVFSRCLGVDPKTREVLLRGEPGAPPAAGQPVTRPAWSEPFVDANGSLARDDGEPFLDTDSNDAFTPEVAAADTNGNGRRDIGLLEHYRKLIALRRDLPSLRRGSFETVLIDEESQLYGFRRKLKDEEVMVILNNSNQKQEAALEVAGNWQDRWNGGQLAATDGRLSVPLAPRGASILVRAD